MAANKKEPKGVRLDHISKIYKDPKTGKDFYAVHDVALDIEPGSFVTLLGPSGCGKTTTLRMIAGFESPDEGEIYLGGEPINELTPNKRDTAMVFQSYALFPHYNVFDNVAYGLRLRKVPKDEIQERVTNILKLVELSDMEQRMTNQLSGGQQQRVALARALVVEPGVLLFDEPLSNLDAKLRVQMRTEIRRIQQALGITAIYVTHDQSEAMAISDNIILMKGGVIAQMGSPTEIYYHPNSEFVADFIGECNFLPCTVTGREGSDVIADVYGHPVKVLSDKDTIGKAEIVLRPEAIEIADQGQLPCKVELSCFMGSYQNYHVRIGDTLVKIADNCPIGRKTYQVGDEACISFRSECAHLLAT
jgi:iron(III) transport system ATP-binding protein